MAGDAEVVVGGNRLTESLEFFTLEFDQFIANGAVQMIVLRVAVIVFVDRSAAKVHPPQEPRIDQFVECSVNGGPANLAALRLLGQVENQFLGIKVVVALENEVDQDLPLLSDPLAFALQEFAEALLRAAGNRDRTE